MVVILDDAVAMLEAAEKTKGKKVPSGKCVAACDSHQLDSSTKQASNLQEESSTQRQAARDERKARSAGKHRPPAVT